MILGLLAWKIWRKKRDTDVVFVIWWQFLVCSIPILVTFHLNGLFLSTWSLCVPGNIHNAGDTEIRNHACRASQTDGGDGKSG